MIAIILLMKKKSATYSVIFYNLLLLLLFFCNTTCKKTSKSTPAHTFLDSKFGFRYNGTSYTLPGKEGIAEWVVDATGFSILRPDITTGIIRYIKNNCAYFEPGNARMINVGVGGGCDITLNGAPIDSTAVYLFQSGFFKIVYTNCVQKSQYDIYSGTTNYFEVCDANGTFELTLKNNENKTITIGEGHFEMYSYRF